MFPDKHVRCGDWTLRSTTIAPIVDVYGHVLHMTVQLLQIRLQVSIQFYHISTHLILISRICLLSIKSFVYTGTSDWSAMHRRGNGLAISVATLWYYHRLRLEFHSYSPTGSAVDLTAPAPILKSGKGYSYKYKFWNAYGMTNIYSKFYVFLPKRFGAT